MDDLKPCPFCGVEVKVQTDRMVDWWWIDGHYIGCFLHSDSRPQEMWEDRRVMIKAWNERAKP